MHWASILTALSLAITSAYLVFGRQWDAAPALLTVGGVGIVVVVGLLGTLIALAPHEERPLLLRVVWNAMRRDAHDALRWFRQKR